MAKAKSKGKAAKPAEGAPVAFEAAADRLTTIVQELEDGDLPLEQALKLFEEGVQVARHAQSRLDEAEQRVEELLRVDEDGKAHVRPLDS